MPWDEAGIERSFTLRLTDSAGDSVKIHDDRPVEFRGQIGDLSDTGSADDEYTRMTDFHGNIALNIGSLPLGQGECYAWRFEVEGEELASTSFAVRK
ncbi:hypothetical protein GCM10009677_53760 [Sphaerisporangium rubeum]|uniref:Uncharacterized protein n=1 Tax=Sphaerisporangium rubeum TaxID=321317 RepID=A0A7X0M9Y3_9ACTN|nr:hypothetical protein [Sphaerisporangium rubeum]MBB6475519.1 hypothetical protein [Sphaerisporangium rubeum]